MEQLFYPIGLFVLINIAIVILGFLIIKNKQVAMSWLLLVLSIAAIHYIFLNIHPAIRMLALIATTFTGMKVVAVTVSYKTKVLTLTFLQWIVFATAWAGMRAEPFETLGTKPLPGAWHMIWFGLSRIVLGILFILLARYVARLPLYDGILYGLQTVSLTMLLLVGLSLVLHFGLLSISAGVWRLNGVNTYYLFKKPATALSLTEFWSKRWNIAFSEMTSIAIFRPLKPRLGVPMALVAAFIFSGLLHELALSLPVYSGYGLPTLYFVIHAFVVLFEKFLVTRQIAFLKNKVLARLWVFFWLVIPIPLLFHMSFLKHIVYPILWIKI
jgi:alginate O-acetyltransferase complex protein AlgI